MNYTVSATFSGLDCAAANSGLVVIAPTKSCSPYTMSPSFRNCTALNNESNVLLQLSSKLDCDVYESAPAAYRKISPGTDVILII